MIPLMLNSIRVGLLAILFSFALSASQQPNIILIYADDLDADEINCTSQMTSIWATHSGAKERKYWNKGLNAKVLTPNIDGLAQSGMLFTRFYVNGTVCTSSRYSLLTGRYPSRGPDIQKDYPAGTDATLAWTPAILRSENNLAKELQNLGYRTGIIGKWHNMPNRVLPKLPKKIHAPNASYATTKEFEQGIQSYYRKGFEYLSNGFGWDVVDRMEWGNSIVNLDWQCDGALDFIQDSKDEPFFLYCSLPVPHGQYKFDYNQIESYDNRVTSNGLLNEPIHVLPTTKDVLARCKEAGVPKENAMATRMDDYVGAILKRLDALGLSENTLIIFTSDHGSRGKNSVYEGGAKVPMLLSWPSKVAAASVCDSLIGNVDLTATLIELAGGSLPSNLGEDSDSFVAILEGKPEPEEWREYMLIEAGNTKGIVTTDWKYLANRVRPEVEAEMNARPQTVFWSGVDHHNYQNENMYPAYWDADQLYDLRNDLYEQQNLAGSDVHSETLEQMREWLSQEISGLPHTFGEF